MFPSYAELHCLTNFSFLRGASHPEELVERAARLGYSALAITDECSLAGVVRAHVAAKAHGLKLIIGAEVEIECEVREGGRKKARATRHAARENAVRAPPSLQPSPAGAERERTEALDSRRLAPDASRLAPRAARFAADAANLVPRSGPEPEASGLAPDAARRAPCAARLAADASNLLPRSGPEPEAAGLAPDASRLRLVLLAADREGYGNLAALITLARRRSRKGEYRLTPQDLDGGGSGCLALLLPGLAPDATHAAWLKSRFPGRCWIAAELLYGGGDHRHLTRLQDLSQACGIPLVAAGDVHMHVRGRRALQDTLTAIRVKRPLSECGAALFPNGERHLRSRERLLRIYPPELLIETVHVADHCRFSLDELRYEYPEEIVPAGETPASWLRKLTRDGFRWRFGVGLEDEVGGTAFRDEAGSATPSLTLPPPGGGNPEQAALPSNPPSAAPPSSQPSPARVEGKGGEACEERFAGLTPPTAPPPLRGGGREGCDRNDSLLPNTPTLPFAPTGAGNVDQAAALANPQSAPPLSRGEGREGGGRNDGLLPNTPTLPFAPTGAGHVDQAAALANPPHAGGWGGRFTSAQKADIAKARALVEHELALIAQLRYEPYFLTVHDIVRFARSQGILCQGRGSAANSAVCYCLGVTEVDPARMEMLFERFLSKERNEPPDIDVDFEHERREEVIQYIYRKYGRERAAIAATVISYRSKSAVRDIGKALGLDLAQVDRLAKNLAFGDVTRVRPERIRECGFDPDSPVIRRLLALVHTVIGFPRHLSQHVGGFVISRGPVSRLVPIENAAMPERTIIQWDKDDLDALGLLKVDVLALGMLTAIRRALDLVSQYRGRPFSMSDVPAEDPQVYEMVSRADTVGVFQIESRAQQAMLPRMRPRCFYDLVIEVAIVRPGPIQGGMIHPYLRRRQGLEPVTYPSEAVRGVLARTLGVPIFQEQVMQLAIVAAGFTPGEADRLRRAMAAWKRRGGLEPFEKRLKEGMRERGYSDGFAQQIFQQILGFGEYGFPESHSASFALLVYVSCWLKCHEPAAFTCALLNSQPMGFYAPAQLVQDAQRHGVQVLPPDVLASGWECALEPAPSAGSQARGTRREARDRQDTSPLTQPAIRLGLRMVKGFSQDAAERLVAAREGLLPPHPRLVAHDGENAAFLASSLAPGASPLTPRAAPLAPRGFSFEHLALAANLNRHDINALAAAGALACITGHRRQAAWDVTGIHQRPPVLAGTAIDEPLPQLAAPTEGDDIVADYATLGLTLGRHPVALLRPQLTRLRMATAAQVRDMPHGRLARAAGLVIGRQRPDTASGVIFVTLEDETGMVNVVVWRSVSEMQRRALLGSHLLAVHGVIERQGEVVHLVAGRLVDHSHLLGRLLTRSRDFH